VYVKCCNIWNNYTEMLLIFSVNCITQVEQQLGQKHRYPWRAKVERKGLEPLKIAILQTIIGRKFQAQQAGWIFEIIVPRTR